MCEDLVRRVGKKFYQEMERIQKQKIDNGEKKVPMNKLTDQIIKHIKWKVIAQDEIDFDFNGGSK